jgi:dTMP kinase
LTIILDLPVEDAARRRGRSADRMEARGAEYLDCVRRGFLTEAERHPDSFRVVDASPDVDVVQKTLRTLVAKFLATRGQPVRSAP